MDITENYKRLALKLKAIAHPVRLCIVKGLMDKSCNVTGMVDCLNMPQSTISQHIAKLKAAGIVEGERSGLEIVYKVVDQDIKRVIKAIGL